MNTFNDQVFINNELQEVFNDIDGKHYHYASYQYEIIIEEIAKFEKDLDDNHEVALKLCNFGQSILLNVTDIGYADPNLIFYFGTVNGKETQLIQHVNQISFLLMAVPKAESSKPAKRIGYLAE